jgi:hypothetical protein
MSQLRPPVHSQAMLIPGHPHHMMMGHSAHGMSPMSMGSAQSPPLHGSLDSMGAHIQDKYKLFCCVLNLAFKLFCFVPNLDFILPGILLCTKFRLHITRYFVVGTQQNTG